MHQNCRCDYSRFGNYKLSVFVSVFVTGYAVPKTGNAANQ